MALFSIVPTWIAVYKARSRDIIGHREWMIRSYSVCFSVAVLLRLSFLWVVPLMIDRIPEELSDPYNIMIFLSWSLPLLYADVWISFNKYEIKLKK